MYRPHYFRCLYDQTAGPLIRGRVEFRRPDPDDPTRSGFSLPAAFQYDTVATRSLVTEAFAAAHGFGDFRATGTPTAVRWFDASAPPLSGWRVFRWVRFRDYENGVSPFRLGDAGGLSRLELRVAFLVVPGVTLTLPLLGLWDVHHYFSVVSSGDEYTFYPRQSRDGNWPLATDGGQGVREVT